MADASRTPDGRGRRPPSTPETEELLPLDARAYDIHEQTKPDDRVRFVVVIATWVMLLLALGGLFTLILLGRPGEQIDHWMGGVNLIGTITAAATGYYFGGRK